MIFLLFFLFSRIYGCMVNITGFIYLFLELLPILAELNLEILLLHIRMLLLDLLDPLHDLRLEKLFFYGADHPDPLAETSFYIYISAHYPGYFSDDGMKPFLFSLYYPFMVLRRCRMACVCSWQTRDSVRSRTMPISFMVISS
jgi:hypothetical protein